MKSWNELSDYEKAFLNGFDIRSSSQYERLTYTKKYNLLEKAHKELQNLLKK